MQADKGRALQIIRDEGHAKEEREESFFQLPCLIASRPPLLALSLPSVLPNMRGANGSMCAVYIQLLDLLLLINKIHKHESKLNYNLPLHPHLGAPSHRSSCDTS